MLKTYILDEERRAVYEPDMLAWARWMETADRTVAVTDNGVILVSTVFLGIDHSFLGPKPILFETMTFLASGFAERAKAVEPEFDMLGLEMWRWHTWQDADEGHWKTTRAMFSRLDQFKGPIAEVIREMRVDVNQA